MWPDDAMEYMNETQVWRRNGQFCVPGCHPHDPWAAQLGGMTNCMFKLQDFLRIFIGFHTLVSVVFLVIPTILVKVSIALEIAKTKAASAENGSEVRPYTLL